MRTSHRPARLLALVVALLLPLAAACGGDDSSDDASDSGADTEQDAATTTEADDSDASSETTEAEASGDEEDALSAAIAAQSEALGIEDVVTDGDEVTLVMADGTDADGAQAACAFAAQLTPDATISVEVDGQVTSCP